VICFGLDLQQGTAVTLRGFRTQGRAENGARWRLRGESAVIRGTTYELTGVSMDLDLEDGRTAKITSRACVYHQDSGLVESQDAVRMESGETSLDGVGFDILLSERRLRVRDQVKMVISGAGGAGAGANLDLFGPGALGKPRPAPDAPAATP
jgi:hypothetical protein